MKELEINHWFQRILSRMKHVGCHKASGLKRLAERWGISPEQCAAFGDGGNDIEMLQYCGHPGKRRREFMEHTHEGGL